MMEDKVMMFIVYMIFGLGVILVIIGFLAYTGQLDLPKFDFWSMLGNMFGGLSSKLPPI
jgi:membrane protein DedA with SNARE-associated domain